MPLPNIKKSIQEIFDLFRERNFIQQFTLESINEIFEIGNEIFMKNNAEEIEKLSARPRSKAPDILDDEPFTFERTFKIYKQLEKKYSEISPELIQRVFEINSQLAWETFRKKYDEYILNIYHNHPNDKYINYLAAVVLYGQKNYKDALKCINIASAGVDSSANYIHLKGLCLMQLGELEAARTYFYQALFLIELLQDFQPQFNKKSDIYPNYPIGFQTSADLIRADLKKLDKIDNIFLYEMLPLID
jgi:tetratricopeptide (TPR) repeat protein